jgi:hypothetical protein
MALERNMPGGKNQIAVRAMKRKALRSIILVGNGALTFSLLGCVSWELMATFAVTT